MSAQILIGDVRAILPTLEADSVDCVVTSPPYWGLRDYGVDGQIGLEPSLGEHLDIMVAVFREVRRILKPEGTLWVNYGDCYATHPAGRSAATVKALGTDDRSFRDKPFSTVGGGLKPKDLCMVPNRLAIRLQEDGWWVRSEIIWSKPNPMPESVRDRPASAHEKVFLLAKSKQYFYDADAIRERAAESSVQRWGQDVENQEGSHRANAGGKTNGTMKAVGGPRKTDPRTEESGRARPFDHRDKSGIGAKGNAKTFRGGSYTGGEPGPRTVSGNEPSEDASRNARNVWTIGTTPFSEAHFATFPEELARRCILAGCPEGGLVLDPFGGAGTVGLVAGKNLRRSILIELNEDYAAIAARRLKGELISVEGGDSRRGLEPLPLFGGIA